MPASALFIGEFYWFRGIGADHLMIKNQIHVAVPYVSRSWQPRSITADRFRCDSHQWQLRSQGSVGPSRRLLLSVGQPPVRNRQQSKDYRAEQQVRADPSNVAGEDVQLLRLFLGSVNIGTTSPNPPNTTKNANSRILFALLIRDTFLMGPGWRFSSRYSITPSVALVLQTIVRGL